VRHIALSACARGERKGVKPVFTLGHVVATPGALTAIENSGQQPGDFLAHQMIGAWGEVPPEDIKENELSLQRGFLLLSAHHTSGSDKLWGLLKPTVRLSVFCWPKNY
jgi:hypothetical protein